MKPKIIPYNPRLKEYSRYLRNNSTLSEVILWNALKSKKLRDYGFNRQKPLDEYIVDFYCKELNLIIEIDGFSHDFKVRNDLKRQQKLESFGLTILRFADTAVKTDLQNVLYAIEGWIIDYENKHPPCPLQRGN